MTYSIKSKKHINHFKAQRVSVSTATARNSPYLYLQGALDKGIGVGGLNFRGGDYKLSVLKL